MNDYVVDFQGVVRLVLKLAGLVMMVSGIVVLAGMAPVLFSGVGGLVLSGQGLIGASGPIILILAGLFLWLFPRPVANTLIHKQSGEDAAGQEWANRLEVVGMGLLGLWLLYRAISDLVYHLFVYRAYGEQVGGYSEFPAYLAATLVEVVLALLLIFGARGIARLIRRIRYGGLAVGEQK